MPTNAVLGDLISGSATYVPACFIIWWILGLGGHPGPFCLSCHHWAESILHYGDVRIACHQGDSTNSLEHGSALTEMWKTALLLQVKTSTYCECILVDISIVGSPDEHGRCVLNILHIDSNRCCGWKHFVVSPELPTTVLEEMSSSNICWNMPANLFMARYTPHKPSKAQSQESLLSNTQTHLCFPILFSFPFVLLPLWLSRHLATSQK